MPGLRVGAHYDLYKDDAVTGKRVLVSTSRTCTVCGRPLTGAVVPSGASQVHVECARRSS